MSANSAEKPVDTCAGGDNLTASTSSSEISYEEIKAHSRQLLETGSSAPSSQDRDKKTPNTIKSTGDGQSDNPGGFNKDAQEAKYATGVDKLDNLPSCKDTSKSIHQRTDSGLNRGHHMEESNKNIKVESDKVKNDSEISLTKIMAENITELRNAILSNFANPEEKHLQEVSEHADGAASENVVEKRPQTVIQYAFSHGGEKSVKYENTACENQAMEKDAIENLLSLFNLKIPSNVAEKFFNAKATNMNKFLPFLECHKDIIIKNYKPAVTISEAKLLPERDTSKDKENDIELKKWLDDTKEHMETVIKENKSSCYWRHQHASLDSASEESVINKSKNPKTYSKSSQSTSNVQETNDSDEPDLRVPVMASLSITPDSATNKIPSICKIRSDVARKYLVDKDDFETKRSFIIRELMKTEPSVTGARSLNLVNFNHRAPGSRPEKLDIPLYYNIILKEGEKHLIAKNKVNCFVYEGTDSSDMSLDEECMPEKEESPPGYEESEATYKTLIPPLCNTNINLCKTEGEYFSAEGKEPDNFDKNKNFKLPYSECIEPPSSNPSTKPSVPPTESEEKLEDKLAKLALSEIDTNFKLPYVESPSCTDLRKFSTSLKESKDKLNEKMALSAKNSNIKLSFKEMASPSCSNSSVTFSGPPTESQEKDKKEKLKTEQETCEKKTT